MKLFPEKLFNAFAGLVDRIAGSLPRLIGGLADSFQTLGLDGLGGGFAQFAGVGDGRADIVHDFTQHQVDGFGYRHSVAILADIVHLDARQLDGLAHAHRADIDGAFFDDQFADDELFFCAGGGCVRSGGGFCRLPRAGKGFDVREQLLQI